jgi:hypothetical protein
MPKVGSASTNAFAASIGRCTARGRPAVREEDPLGLERESASFALVVAGTTVTQPAAARLQDVVLHPEVGDDAEAPLVLARRPALQHRHQMAARALRLGIEGPRLLQVTSRARSSRSSSAGARLRHQRVAVEVERRDDAALGAVRAGAASARVSISADPDDPVGVEVARERADARHDETPPATPRAR